MASQANLPFGTALHKAWENVVLHDYLRQPFDAAENFSRVFNYELDGTGRTYEYPSGFTREEMTAVGRALCTNFQTLWPTLGFTVLTDANGTPALEKTLVAPIGEHLEIKAKMDFTGFSPEGYLTSLDWKSPRSAASESHSSQSDQLTCAQILLDHHGAQLGFPKVERLGFVEGIKRKVPEGKNKRGKGPVIEFAPLVEARPQEEVVEFVQKLNWMAEDIVKGRFPKAPRQAHNTPCDMCDYRSLCLTKKNPVEAVAEWKSAFKRPESLDRVVTALEEQKHPFLDLASAL